MKEFYFPIKNIFWGIFLGPCIGFCVIIFLWFVLKQEFFCFLINYRIFFIIVFIGLRVYSSLISGWRRTSKFASIGGIRSCSQSISYEISLVFLIISLIIFLNIINIEFLIRNLIILLFPLFFLSCVAETNRAPFDFREGERELISGFNVEYGSSGFVLLFLAEYGIILFFSLLLTYFFLINNFIIIIIIILIFLFIRRVYPRFRYDILIKLIWIKFLPISLTIIFLFLSIL